MVNTSRAAGVFRALLLTVVALALAGIGRPLQAQQGMALSPSERAEVAGYTLSVDKAKRFTALGGELSRLLASDPAYRALVTETANQGLTAQAAVLEQVPKAAAALRAAGFSAHEYAVGSRAFRGAEAIEQAQARGRAATPAMQAMFPASAAQVAFVRAHRAELDAIALEHRSHAARP